MSFAAPAGVLQTEAGWSFVTYSTQEKINREVANFNYNQRTKLCFQLLQVYSRARSPHRSRGHR
jgi:hypothetical protein